MLSLYTTPLSANGRKTVAVTHQLGVKVQLVQVDVYSGEGRSPKYLMVNPLGKIPALVDGDLIVTESNAIIQYLSEMYGDYRLWSRNPKERAKIASWLYWESSHWAPTLRSSSLAAFVGHRLGVTVLESEPVVQWREPSLVSTFRYLDSQLEKKEYLMSERLTLADFSVAGMMTYFRCASFPFARYPNLANWFAKIESLPAWQSSESSLWSALCERADAE